MLAMQPAKQVADGCVLACAVCMLPMSDCCFTADTLAIWSTASYMLSTNCISLSAGAPACTMSSLHAAHDVQLMQHESVTAVQARLFWELLAGFPLAVECDPGQGALPILLFNSTDVHLTSFGFISDSCVPYLVCKNNKASKPLAVQSGCNCKCRKVTADPQWRVRRQEANEHYDSRQPVLLSACQLLQQHVSLHRHGVMVPAQNSTDAVRLDGDTHDPAMTFDLLAHLELTLCYVDKAFDLSVNIHPVWCMTNATYKILQHSQAFRIRDT